MFHSIQYVECLVVLREILLNDSAREQGEFHKLEEVDIDWVRLEKHVTLQEPLEGAKNHEEIKITT